MLVIEESGSVRIVTQHDHARLARQILALWVGDGLPEHPLRQELLLAAAEHDCGWQGFDAAPVFDRQRGLPVDFRACPDAERRRIWKESVERVSERNAAAALLVVRHSQRIHADRHHHAEWRDYFSQLTEQRARLEESVDIPSSELNDLAELLWLADMLSLGGCGALERRTLTCRGYDCHLESGRLALRPFPLAGPMTLQVAGRRLPARELPNAEALAEELLNARWERFAVHLGSH